MKNLLDKPIVNDQPDEAQVIADHLLFHPLAELIRQCRDHATLYGMVWNNQRKTPAQIVTAMGTKAAEFLQFARANVERLAGLAAQGGKPLSDFLLDDEWKPRLPLTPNEDGTVTVGTVVGLDAWGRPLPEPTTDPSLAS